MLTAVKPYVEKALTPVASLLKNVSPNVISLFGLVFPTMFLVFVLQGWYWWALLTFVFNGLDMLDGLVARRQNKVTAFGGFLDSTIDRFADGMVIAAFGFAEIVPWTVVMPLVMLSFLISYIRSRTELAAKGALVASVGLIERAERLLTIFAGLVLYAVWPDVALDGHNLPTLALALLTVLSAYTVLQRVQFAYKHLK